jgi:hypothetical protein
MAIHRHEINEGTSDYASPATPGGGGGGEGEGLGEGEGWEGRFNSRNCIGVELIAV